MREICKKNNLKFERRLANKPGPTVDTVRIIFNFGSFQRKGNKVKPNVDDNANLINVLGYFDVCPKASIGDSEKELGSQKHRQGDRY